MARVGKKYADSVKLIEKGRAYDPAEALALVCQTSKAKFDETIEIHCCRYREPYYHCIR